MVELVDLAPACQRPGAEEYTAQAQELLPRASLDPPRGDQSVKLLAACSESPPGFTPWFALETTPRLTHPLGANWAPEKWESWPRLDARAWRFPEVQPYRRAAPNMRTWSPF